MEDHQIIFDNDRYEIIGLEADELVKNSTLHDEVDGFKIVRPEIEFARLLTLDRGTDPTPFEQLIRAGEWDWDRFRYTYGSRPNNSKIYDFIHQLQQTGVRDTLKKTVHFLYRESPPPLKKVLLAIRLRATQSTLSPEKVLHVQYRDDTFHREDIINAYEYFTNHQNAEQDSPNGSDLSRKCRINLDAQILNPASCGKLLQDRRDDIPVDVSLSFSEARSTEWPLNHETDVNRSVKYRFLEEFGLIFYFILWPIVAEDYETIEAKIRSELTVAHEQDIHIRGYSKFIDDVYSSQDTKYWSIERKKFFMRNTSAPIRVIAVEVPNPRFREGISLAVEELKKDIRDHYCEEYGDKYYHAIIHSTDNYADNYHLQQVLDKYT